MAEITKATTENITPPRDESMVERWRERVSELLNMSSVDYYMQVAQGLIRGSSAVNKYGHAIDGIQTTPTDIWDRADATPTQQIWLAPTAARIHTIASTSIADDGSPETAGFGAQAVRIWYLPDWDTAETSEDVVLDGAISVDMSNAAVMINRMKVIPVGSTYGINDGFISATAASDATVTSQIA